MVLGKGLGLENLECFVDFVEGCYFFFDVVVECFDVIE